MRVKVRKTNTEVEVKPLIQNDNVWYVDDDNNVYQAYELEFDKSYNAMDYYWREIRIRFIMKFIDIYQAPATNMNEIFALADKYVAKLKEGY